MIPRRAAILGLAALTSGCGFHPLYAPAAQSQATLGTVYVDIIPNRVGQLLRQALQQRLEGADGATAKRYTLSVLYSQNNESLGVQADNSTTRLRDVGRAVWSLHPLENASVQIAGGTARMVDGYNIIDEQFFYQDLQEQSTQQRLTAALADQIVIGLTQYFDKHPDKT